MRLSQYFLPVLKENPAEAQIVSHRLMLRAGMIKQSSAGIYSWLPLGYKVLRKVEEIVHQEQQRVGHIPMLMPTLQSADLWKESGRYDAYGPEMLRIRDRQDRDMLYGPTNEEMITDIFRRSATCAPMSGWACKRSRCAPTLAPSAATTRMSSSCWPKRASRRFSMTARSPI